MQNQIPKNWQKVKLGELGKIITGKTPSTGDPENFDGNFPFITIPDLKDQRYIYRTERTISEKGAAKLKNLKLPPKAVLMSCLATVGETGITVKESFTNQQINSVVCNLEKAIPEFLYYSFIFMKPRLLRYSGSVYTNISKSKFADFDIELPMLNEQKRTASVLSAFDDKIEVNNKIAKTLEEMAQAIFKEWFVNFRFPGYEKIRFVESELGQIPKGWEVKDLGDVSENFDRKRIPLSNMERAKRKGNIPYYGATGIMDYIDKPLFDGEYLLVAEDGTVTTDDGKPVLQFIEGKFWVNNHAHILRGKDNIPTHYLFYVLKNTYITPYITGAVQLKLTQENLNSIPVIVSKPEVMNKYDQTITPIIKLIRQRESENQKLAALRDLLLPKLMRGKIKI